MSIYKKKLETIYRKPEISKKEKSLKLRSDSDVGIFLKKNHIFNTDKIRKRTFQFLFNANEIKIPLENNQVRIRTQRQINLISIILKFVNDYNFINELTIATYTLNKEALSILLQLFKSEKIKKLNLIVASSYTYRNKPHYECIKQQCKANNITSLVFANIHLKIILLETQNNYYQMEGSMNFSTNNIAEQILIENNKSMYHFDYEFLNVTLRNRKNKALEIIC